jgi:hypothetical protein
MGVEMKAVAGLLLAAIMSTVPMGDVAAQTESCQTACGVFEIKPKGSDGHCRALLAGKMVRSFDCRNALPPRIIAHYPIGFGKFSDVIVIQEQPAGNACSGGRLYLVGVKKSGLHETTAPIDFCSGRDPVVERRGLKIVITFPDGSLNRGAGNGTAAVWEYCEGTLLKIK